MYPANFHPIRQATEADRASVRLRRIQLATVRAHSGTPSTPQRVRGAVRPLVARAAKA